MSKQGAEREEQEWKSSRWKEQHVQTLLGKKELSSSGA